MAAAQRTVVHLLLLLLLLPPTIKTEFEYYASAIKYQLYSTAMKKNIVAYSLNTPRGLPNSEIDYTFHHATKHPVNQ